MRSLPLIMALAIIPSGCSDETQKSPDTVGACDIALDYAKRFKIEWEHLGRPIAISDQPGLSGPSRRKLEQVLADNPAFQGDPEVAITLAAADLRDRHVIDECSNLRSWVQTSSIVSDDARIEELMRQPEWPVAVLSMSLPAVSEDGSTALFYSSKYAGPLEGAALAVTYKKQANGEWVLHDEEELAIS